MPKKEGIRRLFDDIAPRYDLFNHLSSFGADFGWRRKAVKTIVDEARPLDVLDVATGTADFAIAISRKVASGSRIVGIDLSEGMLEVGRGKCVGLPIELQQADCEALPFAEASFDRVSVAFGVRNFEHLQLGLEEMCRVLRPGGQLEILEYDGDMVTVLFGRFVEVGLKSLRREVGVHGGTLCYMGHPCRGSFTHWSIPVRCCAVASALWGQGAS